MDFHRVLRRTQVKMRSWRFRGKTTFPYLSGDCFAALADEVITEESDISRLGKRIHASSPKTYFVRSELLEQTLTEKAFLSTCKVLMCGNSDFNFNESINFPPTIKLVLLQNSLISDNELIFTLPLGIENAKYGRFNFSKLLHPSQPSQYLERVLLPPMAPTNKVRQQINQVVATSDRGSIIDQVHDYLPEKAYFDLTAKYQFILCLPGNGIDSHRVWETLYQGSFPVLIRDEWSQSLATLGLPILEITDLDELTSGLLNRFCDINSNSNPQSHKALWIPYWHERIRRALKW